MKIGKIKLGNSYATITDSFVNFNRLFLDNFTKLAILTILAGYKKSDEIIINDEFPKEVNLKKLSSFTSYILNHQIAPRRFRINITPNQTEKVEIKTKNKLIKQNFKSLSAVLSFSGGLDSTAGLLYALDKKIKILPIWIDFGQRNNLAEYRAMQRILRRLKIKPLIFRLNLKSAILHGWKDWSFIVPGRNFLFLGLANSILKFSRLKIKTIYLCAHKDEMGFLKNRDKSQYFFDNVSAFFSAGSGQKITSLSPFKNYSKSEIISYWRRQWEKKYGISPFQTITCYYDGNCGKCDACLKRAVYLLAGGYNISSTVKINPLTDPAGIIKNSWLPRIKNGKLTRNNKLDFFIAVEKSLKIVPSYVRDFYQNLSLQTLKSIQRRKKEIAKAVIR